MVKVKVEETKGNWIETDAVPGGTYIAVVHATKEGTLRWNNEERPIYRWYFKILDGENRGSIVEGITSTRFTTRSKAYRWWSSATGYKPKPGEEVELEDAIGGLVQITVENRVSRNGRTYSRVTDVSALSPSVRKMAEKLLEELRAEEEEEEEEIPEEAIDEATGEEEEEEEVQEIVIKPKKPAKRRKK